MRSQLIMVRGSGTTGTNLTYYGSMVGGYGRAATVESSEANAKVRYRTAGILSGFWVRVHSNGITATTTFRVRKNGANGNQSVSFSSSQSGILQDTSATDSIAAGDDVAYSIVTGGTGTTLVDRSVGAVWDSSCQITGASQNGAGGSGASTPYYGQIASLGCTDTTESNHQATAAYAYTARNLALYISANTRTTTSTFGTRKNSGTGGLSISVPAGGSGGTGLFEDTGGSDTIAVGDNHNLIWSNGTGSGSATVKWHKLELTPDDGVSQLWNDGIKTATTWNANTTRWFGFSGDLSVGDTTTESNVDGLITHMTRLQELRARILTNTVTATSTISTRKNGGAGNCAVSIGNSQTGLLTDASNGVDTYVPGDTMHLQVITGATGTSMTVTFITARGIQFVRPRMGMTGGISHFDGEVID